MTRLRGSLGTLFALLALCLPAAASAQSLPVSVKVAGNVASVRIGSASSPLADLTLSFDDATGLSASSLGISAELVNLTDPTLLARLPGGAQTAIPSALPLLVTIEPPAAGGLVQRRLTHVELHTHALPYVAGTPLRLFKAQLGGPFRDITEDVLPGSVRTRGTTPGWSQFVVVADLRPATQVINEKFAALRATLGAVSPVEAAPLRALLDAADAAVDDARWADAIVALDSFSARASERAGVAIPDTWRATRDARNLAGELLAGASTLRFSIGVKRDFGD